MDSWTDRIKQNPIFNKYELVTPCGKGRNGIVFQAKIQGGDGTLIAIKLRDLRKIETEKSMKNEYNVLRKLDCHFGEISPVPSPYYCHLIGEMKIVSNIGIIHMQLGGQNLSNFCKKQDTGVLGPELGGLIICEVLHCLEEVYHAGFLHGDVKASNFVFATAPLYPNHLRIINFEQTEEIKDSTDKRRGTTMLCSVNSSATGVKYRGVDDLWSVLYMWLFVAFGLCAWKNECDIEDREESKGKVCDLKIKFNKSIRGQENCSWKEFNVWMKKKTDGTMSDKPKYVSPYDDEKFELPLPFSAIAQNLNQYDQLTNLPFTRGIYQKFRSDVQKVILQLLSCNYTYTRSYN